MRRYKRKPRRLDQIIKIRYCLTKNGLTVVDSFTGRYATQINGMYYQGQQELLRYPPIRLPEPETMYSIHLGTLMRREFA